MQEKQSSNRSSRAYLSMGHLKSAAHFARRTGEFEQKSDLVLGWISPHDSYAMGAVLSNTAFLEAAVNELYTDVMHDATREFSRRPHSSYYLGMVDDLRYLLSSLWKTDKRQTSVRTLEKYQIALELAGKQAFETGVRPYQDVDLLTKLRNALIHLRPESEFEADDIPQYLERGHSQTSCQIGV